MMMRSKSAFIAGLVAGIASPGTIGAQSNYKLPRGTDLNRMRGDVVRLGQDFKTVISREHGKRYARLQGLTEPVYPAIGMQRNAWKGLASVLQEMRGR